MKYISWKDLDISIKDGKLISSFKKKSHIIDILNYILKYSNKHSYNYFNKLYKNNIDLDTKCGMSIVFLNFHLVLEDYNIKYNYKRNKITTEIIDNFLNKILKHLDKNDNLYFEKELKEFEIKNEKENKKRDKIVKKINKIKEKITLLEKESKDLDKRKKEYKNIREEIVMLQKEELKLKLNKKEEIKDTYDKIKENWFNNKKEDLIKLTLNLRKDINEFNNEKYKVNYLDAKYSLLPCDFHNK